MRTFAILAALTFAACSLPAFSQSSFKYVAIDVPGAQSTIASGINNSNVIVGNYVDSANRTHGFRFQNSHFTAIDFPGSIQTFANGINDLGDVVGSYSVPGTANNPANQHGFLLHNGVFKTIDHPGSQFTAAQGINKFGTIVGSYDGAHGFVYKNGVFTTRDVAVPQGTPPDTQLNGISNLNEIVGQVFSGDNWRGFWFVGSDLDYLKPFLARDNMVMGVNGRGDLVGCNADVVGFLAHNPESGEVEGSEGFPNLQDIFPPNAHDSCATSITYARSIVGWYDDAQFKRHGFLAIPQ